MRKAHGFTLLELMVVIGLVAILSAISTPNVIRWLNNQKFNSAVREVNAFIQHARMEAVKENTDKWIIFSGDNQQYRLRFWDRQNARWINEPWQELPPGITMTFNNGAIRMNHRGMATQLGTVTINGPQGQTLRIRINITGSTRITG